MSRMCAVKCSGQRGAEGDALPAALGFITNATSVSAVGKSAVRSASVTRLRIDREGSRIRRMRTAVGQAARLLHFDAHAERSCQLWNLKFITLTYADVDGWEPGHFSKFRNAMAMWCRARKIRLRFVWVAELQTRGAIHYHVVVWLPKGAYLPRADTQGWWPHGMTNIVTATSPIGYITKYASKTTVDDALRYPKGARMCGHGGLQSEGRRHLRYWQAPFWVRDGLGGKADIRKVSGGYADKFTGEFLPSPWRVLVDGAGQVWAYRIDNQPMELAA